MTDDTENASQKLAQRYRQLGGKRLSVLDDNIVTIRQWEKDNPEAEAFWKAHIATLPDEDKRDVEKFLPDINAL